MRGFSPRAKAATVKSVYARSVSSMCAIARILLPVTVLALATTAALDSSAQARTLARDPRLTITSQVEKKVTTMVIALKASTSPEVMELRDPARLVVDFPFARGPLLKPIRDPRSSVFTTIRFGQHPDRYRIVIDLVGSSIPPYSTRLGKNGITIIFNPKQVQPGAAKSESASAPARVAGSVRVLGESSTPAVSQQPTAVAEEAPKPSAALINQGAHKSDGELTGASSALAPQQPPAVSEAEVPPQLEPIATPEFTPEAEVPTTGPLTLSAISFELSAPQKTPVVALAFSGKPMFKFSKRQDQIYAVVIPGCTISGEHLTLPHFPPQDFAGLSMVEAKQTGENVELTFTVERSARTTAYINGNNILVRTTKAGE